MKTSIGKAKNDDIHISNYLLIKVRYRQDLFQIAAHSARDEELIAVGKTLWFHGHVVERIFNQTVAGERWVSMPVPQFAMTLLGRRLIDSQTVIPEKGVLP